MSQEDARRLVEGYVRHDNEVHLHSATGDVTPAAKLAGCDPVIVAERDRKLEAARQRRQKATIPSSDPGRVIVRATPRRYDG